jgi:predicted transcriptional regulator
MGTVPASNEDDPSLPAVLAVLDDADCRTILRTVTQPMTAKEITETCDIPQSTVYRKVDHLSTATLVRELHSVHPEQGRITRYQRDFDELNVSITDDERFDVAISRPKRTVDERLADMWSEMGDEL